MARKKATQKSASKSAAKSAKRSAVAAAVKESAKKPARKTKAAKEAAAPEKPAPAPIEAKALVTPAAKPANERAPRKKKEAPAAPAAPVASVETKPPAKKRGSRKKEDEALAKPVQAKAQPVEVKAPAPKPEPVVVKTPPAASVEAKPPAKKRGTRKKKDEAPAKPVQAKAPPVTPAPVVVKAPAPTPAPAAKKLAVEVKPAPKAVAFAKPAKPAAPAKPAVPAAPVAPVAPVAQAAKKSVQPTQPAKSVARKELPAPVARKELPAPVVRKELAAPPVRKELLRPSEGKPPAERTAAKAPLITPLAPPAPPALVKVPVVEKTTPPATPSESASPVRRAGSRRAVARSKAPRTVPPVVKPSSIFAKLRAAEALKKKTLPVAPKAKAVPPVPAAPAEPAVAPLAPVQEHEPAPLPSEFVDRGAALPNAYGLDRLVALVRDPKWLFAYWELTGGLLDRVKDERGHGLIDASAWVLRIHRLHEGVAVDVELDPGVGNWYIDVGGPGRYQLELGLLTPDGEFITLLASQVVETPGLGPSNTFDEEWRLRMEDEERLLALLRKELGMDARLGGASNFVGASVLPSSWRLPGSFLGASFSGRPAAGSWAWSFLGASGLPTSGRSVGSGGWMNVGWIVGADGRHEAELFRPMRNGGPNWNEQKNLQRLGGPGKSQQPHFKVRLPRTVKGAPLPAPSWPPTEQRPRSAVRTRRTKPKAKGAGKAK